jgi:hypothetical protein
MKPNLIRNSTEDLAEFGKNTMKMADVIMKLLTAHNTTKCVSAFLLRYNSYNRDIS